MFTPPIERSLGEAFISGAFDIDGDICSAVMLFDAIAARRFTLGDLVVLTRDLLTLPKPGARRLPEYFAHAYRLLKPGGLFLNHGIARQPPITPVPSVRVAACCAPPRAERDTLMGRVLRRWLLGQGQFAQRYIFPDGELVPVSFVNLAAERAGFEVRDVENLREHSALTLRHWVNRLEARQAEAMAIANEVLYRTWRLYMAACAYSFATGTISVHQTLLSKPAGGTSELPLTRADLYVQE